MRTMTSLVPVSLHGPEPLSPPAADNQCIAKALGPLSPSASRHPRRTPAAASLPWRRGLAAWAGVWATAGYLEAAVCWCWQGTLTESLLVCRLCCFLCLCWRRVARPRVCRSSGLTRAQALWP